MRWCTTYNNAPTALKFQANSRNSYVSWVGIMWYILFHILCLGRYHNSVWHCFSTEPRCVLRFLFNQRILKLLPPVDQSKKSLCHLCIPAYGLLIFFFIFHLHSVIQWSSRGKEGKGHPFTVWNSRVSLWGYNVTTRLEWQGLGTSFWMVLQQLQLGNKLILNINSLFWLEA